jgi:hypothetical protein
MSSGAAPFGVKYSPEQILRKLMTADRLLAEG